MANTPQQPRPLSHSATARALRAFIYSSGMWGAWGQMVGVGTAAFTGFALWMGASETEIASLVSVSFLTSLAQIISPALMSRFQRKKVLIFCLGCFEMLCRSSIVLIPLFLDASGRILAMGILLALGLACGQINSPVYNEWLSNTVPQEMRGRFTGRQTIANLLTGILAGYLVGLYLDLFPADQQYTGFVTVFAVAVLLGIGGYISFVRAPIRPPAIEPNAHTGNLLAPFKDRNFRTLLTFFISWHFASGIAGPFYTVFMLKTLHISYANVALLNSLLMASMVVGYRIWGNLVDRYGSKAVLQLMVPPTALVPVLWVFNSPDNYILAPVALALNGLLYAGILVSVNPLLYSLLPEGRARATYFATWSCTFQVALAGAPLLGGALAKIFSSIQFELLGFPVGNMQLIFLVSAGLLLLPTLFLRPVQDLKQTTARQLLAYVGQGNLLGYLYGTLLYGRTGNEQSRARAARHLGRSKSPMALEQLIQALEDASPEVRRQAAQGLGETRAQEAIVHLVEELADEESDIRSEAAEALGKIGDPQVIDPLLNALDDPDTRVQISAIQALSEIGGDEAGELLFWKFADQFNRATFPTLADVLGRKHDLRMVRPTLDRLDNFRSPAIRLQLLNSICRTLGAQRQFYQLVSQDPLTRAENMEELLGKTQRAFRRARILKSDTRKKIIEAQEDIRKAFDAGETDLLAQNVLHLVEFLQDNIGADTVNVLGVEVASRIGATVLAVRTFLEKLEPGKSTDIQDVYLIVCLWCIGDALESTR
ncbi:MAG: MFS transporter [bacterium]|nr:MFS transporter [bacterium]